MPSDAQTAPAVEQDPFASELLVDPEISRTKFAREIESFHAKEKEHLQRGTILFRAVFPEALLLFAQPAISPTPVVFAARLGFENYDLWPPSVRFVHPFTLEPLKASEMPTQFLKRYPRPAATHEVSLQAPTQLRHMLPDIRPLLQTHADQRPFLCVRGVREYHHHPHHTNDPWLAHRGTGIGTLDHLVRILYRHGVAPIRQFGLHMQFQVQFGDIAISNIPE